VGHLVGGDQVVDFPLPLPAAQVALDTTGMVWFATGQAAEQSVMGRLDPADGQVDQYPIPARMGGANALTLGPDDQIWFIESRFAEDPNNPGVGVDTIGRVTTGAPVALIDAEDPHVLVRIHRPNEVWETENVAKAGAIVLLLYLLMILPSTVFNSTIEANLERIRQWRLVRLFARRGLSGWQGWPGLLVFAAIAAVIYAIPPLRTGLGEAAIALISFAIALLASASIGVAIANRRLRHLGSEVVSRVLPVALPIAVVFAFITYLAGFDALFAYGVIAGWVVASGQAPDSSERGRIAFSVGAVVLAISVVAWSALGIDFGSSAAGRAGRGALEALFLIGVDSLLFGMIPARFLPGAEVRAWSRPGHILLWLAGAGLFALAVIGPGLEDFHVNSVVALGVVAGGFALITLALWLVMRTKSQVTAGSHPEA
jgi:hypothetical protein